MEEEPTCDLLQEIQTGSTDARHADGNGHRGLALVVPCVRIGSVRVQHLSAQHIVSEGRQVQRRLSVLQPAQVSVRSPLQEHATVRVVALNDGVTQQEAVLNVYVGVVIEQNANAAGALTDNRQLKRRCAFVAERVHLGFEL